MCARICGTNGASFGASAMIVASTLPTCQPSRLRQAEDVAQQRPAVGALPARIAVGEVPAEVAQRERAEQRVGDRVQQHVGVAVAEQAALERNDDAAQHQRPAGDQRVHVEAVADAETHPEPFSWAARIAAASARSCAKRDLDVLRAADDQPRPRQPARGGERLDRLRLVGGGQRGVGGEGFAQDTVAEHLRRLRLPQAGAVGGGSTRAGVAPSPRFSVSATGIASRPPTGSPRSRSTSRDSASGRHAGARRVVDDDPVLRRRVRGQRRQRVARPSRRASRRRSAARSTCGRAPTRAA